MRYSKHLYTVLTVLVASCLLVGHTGCWKEEYSYEAQPLDTTTLPNPIPLPDTTDTTDTTITIDTTTLIPRCAFCEYATSLSLGEWQFQFDTLFLCGKVASASLNASKDVLTFTGPSACTPGTGLIITADFNPITFDADRAGLITTNVTCRYYNNNGPTDLFTTGVANKVTLTINQYEAQSGMAVGHFSGTVVTARGAVVSVTTGMFKIQL